MQCLEEKAKPLLLLNPPTPTPKRANNKKNKKLWPLQFCSFTYSFYFWTLEELVSGIWYLDPLATMSQNFLSICATETKQHTYIDVTTLHLELHILKILGSPILKNSNMH